MRFLDLQQEDANPLNGSIIGPDELAAVLRSGSLREPFLCELTTNSETRLTLGIGPGEGCVQYSSADGEPPYLMARSAKELPAGEEMEFLAGGTLTPISGRFRIPMELIEETAARFLATGERSENVEWEEI